MNIMEILVKSSPHEASKLHQLWFFSSSRDYSLRYDHHTGFFPVRHSQQSILKTDERAPISTQCECVSLMSGYQDTDKTPS